MFFTRVTFKGTHNQSQGSLDSNYQNSILYLDMFFKSYSWYSKSLKGVTLGELNKTLLSSVNVYQNKPENLFTQKVMTS